MSKESTNLQQQELGNGSQNIFDDPTSGMYRIFSAFIHFSICSPITLRYLIREKWKWLAEILYDIAWNKIVFGLVRLNFGDFLKFSPVSTTRGHPYKLYTSHCTSIRSRFFAHRVIKAWNSLPQSTNFSSLAAFKRSILQTDHSKHLTMFFVWCRGVDCIE